jgi:predicted SAM-dependent methyltransferase
MDNKLKLHLGCGDKILPDFINIDIQDYPGVDKVTSVSRLDDYADKSVDLIYACHILEHFKKNETLAVVKEWHRVLKIGGILRVCVPDFRAITEVYLKHKKIMGAVNGGQRDDFDIHYNTFDYASLEDLLLQAKFNSVRRYDWRNTSHAVYDDYSQAYYPHMDKDNGLLISLNMEATK